MPTTGTVLAKNFALYTGGTPVIVTCQTNMSLTFSTNMFSTSCKDAGAWDAQQPGLKSWGASVEGNFAFDATYGYSELFAAQVAGTAVPVVAQTGVTGDLKYSGTAYVSNLELNSSGNDEAVTFSCELTGTGALVEATVS